MAAKAFSKEELNFFKFASIVLDEFPKMLRSTFVTLWDTKIAPLPGYHEWDDTPEVRQLFLAREGGTPKIPVSDSFEKWDCTALFQATIYSKSFGISTTSPTTKKSPTIQTLFDQFIKGKKPSPFHLSLNSPTGNHNETIALAIDQVRLLRNTLCHSSESSIKRGDFDNYVRLAKDAFDAVKFSTSQIDDIGILEEEDFPTEKFNKLNKKIVADLHGSNKFLKEKLEAMITTHIDESKVFQESVLQKLGKMEVLLEEWKSTTDHDSKKDNKPVTGQEKLLAINALCSGLSSGGGDFVFRITAKHVKVITDMKIIADVTLGELIDALEIINPTVFQKATKRGFGDERDDQEFKKFKKGSLHVPLHCFTDERFLEVLEDFKSGRLKERLLKEFSLIGVIVEGMEIEIMNMDEVNKTEEAIMKSEKKALKRVSAWSCRKDISTNRVIDSMSSPEREKLWENADPDSSLYQTPRESEAKGEISESKYTETEELSKDSIYEVFPKNQQPSNNVHDTLQDTKACYENVSQKYENPSSQLKKASCRKERRQEKKPQKDVEDIKDVYEMAALFKLLHIKHDHRKFDLDEMLKTVKKELKEQSSGSGKYSNGTTGYKVIAKAKAEDMLKREKLEQLYSEVEDCVKQLHDRAIEVLDVYYCEKGALKALEEQKKSLTKTEYNVLIAGESSAGKSSLVNLILGEELLAHHFLNTTSTICELKFGEERKMIVHYKYDEEKKSRPLPVILTLESEENYYNKIAPFVQVTPNELEKGSDYARVEIFWPHELLQEGVVIIDSPGLGESDEMDEVLMNYLPNAFAFIYVLDTSHAGGIQKDIKEKLMDILKVVQSSDNGVETLQNLAECSLFVCNKWDLVREDQRKTVKKYVTAKLNECWENSNLNHQIVCMSITDAIKVQKYGGVTEEFNLLLKQIKTMVLKAINIRLYNHWQWLYAVLHHIHRVTYFFNQEIQSTHQETCERMASIEERIERIEQQEQEVRKSMETRVQYQTKVLNAKLVGYVHSTEFEMKLCTWIRSSCPPPGVDWETTKSNVKKAIDYKFKELLIQWEKNSHVYDEIHRKLLDEFRTRLNLLKEELQGVDKAMHSVERQTDYTKNTKNKSKIPTAAKVLFGATSPLWIPFGVAGLVFGIPVLGALAVRQKVDERRKLDDYKRNPGDYLQKRSRKYLERLPKLHVLQYAQRQMEHTRMVLLKYADQLPILIDADRKLVKQLTNETLSHDDVFKLYDPIQKQSARIIDTIIPLGVELCPATVNVNDLDWKEDSVSSLGKGDFSTVYKGKLNDAGGTESDISKMDVAVKVFTHSFDAPNTRFFLYEEVQIRDLEHKNVLKYFGAARITSLSSNMYQFIFVTKACRENLRNVIFRNRNLTPAKSENTKLAIGKFFNWAMEIADGLNYIHKRGLIHRHLKLENILEDENGTAMISDIGIVGRFLETEKSIIYLAPEVLKVLTNRTKESDIYSYGIVLWEMWYGMPAFLEHVPIKKSQFQKMIANGIRPKADNKRISIPAIHDVMKNCWATEAEKRYSAKKCSGKFRELQNEQSETEDTTF